MILVKTRWMIPLILDGSKTETRRLWEKPQVRLGSIHVCKPSGREPAFGRVRVVGLWQERLADITVEGARAEGYPDRDSFFQHFCVAHSQRRSLGKSSAWWLDLRDRLLAGSDVGPLVWAVKFELVNAAGAAVVSTLVDGRDGLPG